MIHRMQSAAPPWKKSLASQLHPTHFPRARENPDAKISLPPSHQGTKDVLAIKGQDTEHLEAPGVRLRNCPSGTGMQPVSLVPLCLCGEMYSD
jgi:hypothetical protein